MLRVQAASDGYKSEHSVTSFGRTRGTEPPGKMSQLVIMEKTPTSIIVGWTTPGDSGDGEITAYIIR